LAKVLLDEENKLAVIIENKIGSSEHSDQLRRYRQIVKQHYPDLRQICLFLTPEGDEPSETKYIPIDYQLIAESVEGLVKSRASTLGPDVRTLMTHYSQMLRRHIVSESEIADLCRKIYRKHQRALDMIYEYRPDQQAAIREILESLVQAEPSLDLDHCSKSYIRFAPKTWDKSELLLQGRGWTRSRRILLFEFGNYTDRLRLSLIIGPGLLDTRQKLMEMAQNRHPLKPASKSLGKMYNTIYVRDWLRAKDYEDASIDDLEVEIQSKWSQFLEHDLPEIHEILQKREWIWMNN
jgi:PD-(D/E)XK nuclease superfamily